MKQTAVLVIAAAAAASVDNFVMDDHVDAQNCSSVHTCRWSTRLNARQAVYQHPTMIQKEPLF
jgi:hypothetical protein